MIDPKKVNVTCPHCGKKLRFGNGYTDEENDQKRMYNWYFYCGCMEGTFWTWAIEKTTEKWQYHDWVESIWKYENPFDKEVVQFT